jgi:hypothetical protein
MRSSMLASCLLAKLLRMAVWISGVLIFGVFMYIIVRKTGVAKICHFSYARNDFYFATFTIGASRSLGLVNLALVDDKSFQSSCYLLE